MIPPWLESLLSAPFFRCCQIHGDVSRNECNMFCLDCSGGEPFCFYCRETRHPQHNVIQIRRSSYHDVVRVREIHEFLDVSGVQTYVINGARVLFLNERPQPRVVKGGTRACESCGRGLLESLPFCSLGCKVAFMKKGTKSTTDADQGDESYREEEKRNLKPLIRRSSRRKGIPRRAPLGN